ncbi:MAG TPA: carbohydrate ABC transporter permease [Acetivibrio clariflavus]|nr:carbohydrate ABC transporter permease [Acetivibrio clariflavus]HPU41929.1 carbohydrate ABC transporter permease [Acetivibrio clariflavus]
MKLGKKKSSTLRINSVSPSVNLALNIFFSVYCLMCIAPLVLIFMVSITDQTSLAINGYSFFPSKISFDAYKYLFSDLGKLFRSYGITIFTCVVGTFFCVLFTMLYAYPISRKSFKYRNFFSFFIFFTMLFQGGLVPWYILYTKYLRLQNNLIALIMPAVMNAFYVLVTKTFFSINIPDSVLEAARIDGASEFRIFWQIVIPMSTPVIATIALFSSLNYWNDWYLCLLYINDPKYYNLQYSMYQALRSLQFLTSSLASASGNVSSSLANVPGETLRMAMAILGIGPIVFAYPFFQRYFIKGLTIGAVKG